MSVPGSRYHANNDAEAIAATEVQAHMRGALARKQVCDLPRSPSFHELLAPSHMRGALARKQAAKHKMEQAAAFKITRRAKVHLTRNWAKRRIAESRIAAAEKWEAMSKAFAADWPKLKEEPRVLIHLVRDLPRSPPR